MSRYFADASGTEKDDARGESPFNDGDAAFNLAMDKIERGQVPSPAELEAAKLCLKCTGYGYVTVIDRDADGVFEAEVTCNRCDGSGRRD